MKVKGIIFDKDGTLLKFKEFWFPVAKAAAEMLPHRAVRKRKLALRSFSASMKGI